jgi:hypothetical protein
MSWSRSVPAPSILRGHDVLAIGDLDARFRERVHGYVLEVGLILLGYWMAAAAKPLFPRWRARRNGVHRAAVFGLAVWVPIADKTFSSLT